MRFSFDSQHEFGGCQHKFSRADGDTKALYLLCKLPRQGSSHQHY